MRQWIAMLLAGACCDAHAAFEHVARSSNVIAMGGASVAMMGNPSTVFSNPGALPAVHERMLSLHYSPQPFGLKELSHAAFSFVEPTDFGTFAASGSRYGFELYRETDVQVSYGMAIDDHFSIGTNAHYYHLTIERYGSAPAVGIDVGLLAQLSDQLRWGFAAFNVNAPVIGRSREKLPQVISTGLTYSPIREAILGVDLAKDIRYPMEFRFGVQYTLLELLALRAGTTGEPSTLSAGLGIQYSLLQLDYAFTNHNELGMTHQFSLALSLGEL